MWFSPKQLTHLNKVSGLFDVCTSLWWFISWRGGAVRTEAALVSLKPSVWRWRLMYLPINHGASCCTCRTVPARRVSEKRGNGAFLRCRASPTWLVEQVLTLVFTCASRFLSDISSHFALVFILVHFTHQRFQYAPVKSITDDVFRAPGWIVLSSGALAEHLFQLWFGLYCEHTCLKHI